MKKGDLLWILAYPLYQLIGTFRHEASHALVAMAQGNVITEFVFWPTSGYWGRVAWDGPATVATMAAPYICDLLTFLIFFLVCMTVISRKRWLWVNGVAVGIISPLVNSFYNYQGGLRKTNNSGLSGRVDLGVHGIKDGEVYAVNGTTEPLNELIALITNPISICGIRPLLPKSFGSGRKCHAEDMCVSCGLCDHWSCIGMRRTPR